MIKIRKSLPEYTLELQECSFTLRPLSEVELEQCNYMLVEMIQANHTILPPKAVKFILQNCLIDWTGVRDENDKEYKYKPGNESFLPTKIRMELASDVYVKSQLTEEEKKS